MDHSPSTDLDLHPDFCAQGQGKVKESGGHPSLPIFLKLEHRLSTPWACPSSDSWNAPSLPLLFLSRILPLLLLLFEADVHLSLCPPASGKLVTSRPFFFNCLWPEEGDHLPAPVHSSASTPANSARLPRAPRPLLTSVSFCFSPEKPT